MASARPANSTNLCRFVLLLSFVALFTTSTFSSQTSAFFSSRWKFGRHYLAVNQASPVLIYCFFIAKWREGSRDPSSCNVCQWCECTYAWSHCVQLSGWLLSVCPAHVWHASFPSHRAAPTNPGRNTVDRVQMDSLRIWQILEMDFTACQNKQCFSAWGSQRDGQRGLRWMVDRAELHVTLSLPRQRLRLPPLTLMVHVQANTNTHTHTGKHAEIKKLFGCVKQQ